MKTIVHISTVHPRRDTRIFYRECLSLVKNGFNVILVVADGLGNEAFEKVEIIDLGKENGRISNFIKPYFAILKFIKKLKPDLVHFHDAELMIVGKAIQRKGIPVFYDIHENVAAQILDKKHIKKYLRKPLHYTYKLIEKLLINNFHLILAEDSYSKIYRTKGKTVTVVLNLPESNSFKNFITDERTENGVFYIGGVSNERGLDVIIEALHILKRKNIDFFMHYIGAVSNNLLSKLSIKEIDNNIKFYGRMDLMDGYLISKKCKVGLAVLKPINNYLESYPTKFFEYMSIKLPVITSNFKLYKNVIETHNCGYCIDPFSATSLANKIEVLLKDDDLVKLMGENGYKATLNKYNWSQEELKLLSIYNSVLEKE